MAGARVRVYVRVRVRARACVCVCTCVCARACVCGYAYVRVDFPSHVLTRWPPAAVSTSCVGGGSPQHAMGQSEKQDEDYILTDAQAADRRIIPAQVSFMFYLQTVAIGLFISCSFYPSKGFASTVACSQCVCCCCLAMHTSLHC